MRFINSLPEREIIKLWQQLLRNRTELVTEAGEPLEVIYPGRVNDDRGADFRDAVIATDQGLMQGDIEVHVNSSGWQAHQHHHDPNYNRVILHVVMWPDTKKAANRQSGKGIPVLALHRYLRDSNSHPPNGIVSKELVSKTPPASFRSRSMMPCWNAAAGLPAPVLLGILERAGEARFLAKATGFEADLARMEAGQALYQGVMGALGYAKNKHPFLELARKLPWRTLQAIVSRKLVDEECLAQQQALLFGTAGLLPSQRWNYNLENSDDQWVNELERQWAASGRTAAMSAGDWHLFKVRPNNSPLRRMAAVSYIVLRYHGKDMLAEMVKMVAEASLDKLHGLAPPLVVMSDSYWADHSDFGSHRPNRNPTLIGSGRAADIIVNVVLPFTFAWSKLTAQPELGQKALDVYHHYPRLASNTVERHMWQQLELRTGLVNSARRQQGLAHIYNTLCIQGKCNRCPLGQLEAGNNV